MSTDACWGGHFCVEPGIFVSNRAFLCRHYRHSYDLNLPWSRIDVVVSNRIYVNGRIESWLDNVVLRGFIKDFTVIEVYKHNDSKRILRFLKSQISKPSFRYDYCKFPRVKFVTIRTPSLASICHSKSATLILPMSIIYSILQSNFSLMLISWLDSELQNTNNYPQWLFNFHQCPCNPAWKDADVLCLTWWRQKQPDAVN